MNMSRRIGLLSRGKRLLQLNVTKCDCLDCWKRFKPSGMRKEVVARLNEPAGETNQRLACPALNRSSLPTRGTGFKLLVGKPLVEVEVRHESNAAL